VLLLVATVIMAASWALVVIEKTAATKPSAVSPG
jgi:hypothetical protein